MVGVIYTVASTHNSITKRESLTHSLWPTWKADSSAHGTLSCFGGGYFGGENRRAALRCPENRMAESSDDILITHREQLKQEAQQKNSLLTQ